MARFPEAGGFPGSKHFFDVKKPITIKSRRRKNPRFVGFETHHAPYGWTPHHLIPVEHVQSSSPANPFSSRTLKFIELSFWEVDNGHNLMLLPGRRSGYSSCAYHCLLPHVDNHPGYRRWVRSVLKKLNTQLEAALSRIERQQEQNQEKHEHFLDALVDKLYAAEELFWETLKRLGVDHVALLAGTGTGLRDELVKSYKGRWGALA